MIPFRPVNRGDSDGRRDETGADRGRDRRRLCKHAAPCRCADRSETLPQLTAGTCAASQIAAVDRAAALAPAFGITRIGTLTGLDRLGIPVAIAVRPLSCSASVAMGKGETEAAARAGALMEAVEVWHAERVTLPVSWLRADAPGLSGRLAALGATERLGADDRLPFVPATCLLTGKAQPVPLELVSTRWLHPREEWTGRFPASTNGLAAGASLAGAAAHALCELVERDAVTLFMAKGPEGRDACRLDLAGLPAAAAGLVARFEAAGLATGLWNVTADTGVPAILAWAVDRDPQGASAFGAAADPDPGRAMVRALCEAAQHRLTLVSGTRDDLAAEDYAPVPPGVHRARRALIEAGPRPVPVSAIAPLCAPGAGDESRLAAVTGALATAGFGEVLLCDLSRPGIGIPVVRCLVPGLEAPHDHPERVPGPRARAAAAGA